MQRERQQEHRLGWNEFTGSVCQDVLTVGRLLSFIAAVGNALADTGKSS